MYLPALRPGGPQENRPGRKAGKKRDQIMSAEGAAQHHFAGAGPLGLINHAAPTPSLRSGPFSAGASRLEPAGAA